MSQQKFESTDTTGQELAQSRAGNPLDIPTEAFSQALERRGTNRKALIQWVRDSLVENVDFGKIQVWNKKKQQYVTSKPSLWKPGSEKICGMLGVTPVYPRMKDYEEAALNGVAIQSIVIRCHLIDGNGNTVADGIGARNIKQDNGDLNKALKMACKSAHIDATLRMAGLSEVFTQDIEDQISGQQAEQGAEGLQPITEEQAQEVEELIVEWLDLKTGKPGAKGSSKKARGELHDRFADWCRKNLKTDKLEEFNQNAYHTAKEQLERKIKNAKEASE